MLICFRITLQPSTTSPLCVHIVWWRSIRSVIYTAWVLLLQCLSLFSVHFGDSSSIHYRIYTVESHEVLQCTLCNLTSQSFSFSLHVLSLVQIACSFLYLTMTLGDGVKKLTDGRYDKPPRGLWKMHVIKEERAAKSCCHLHSRHARLCTCKDLMHNYLPI